MAIFPSRRLIQAALITALGHATTACAQTDPLVITDTGQGQLSFGSTAIGELSGITYLGGDSYFVVSDTNGTMAPATIVIDRSTGQITSSSIGTAVSVAGGSDLEGVAYDPRDGTVLISDEVGSTITRHLITDGSQTGSIAVPAIYSNVQSNRGLESLSLDPAGYNLWTANEEALTGDGPLSSTTGGSAVRLQRFDAAGQPAAQFGYLTEPHLGGNSAARSGVVDLVALPDGGLISMERELGVESGSLFPTYRIRLYEVGFDGAVDTTNTASLINFNDLATKSQLYQFNSGFSNFEGITLGPMLSNGDFALILVSDDGATFNPQNLIALRLSGLAVEGDVNGDFVVDKDDLAVVLGAWGSSVTAGDRLAGDLTGDGGVGVADLDTVLANWSTVTPPTVTVPEPGGLGSIALGGLMLLGYRW